MYAATKLIITVFKTAWGAVNTNRDIVRYSCQVYSLHPTSHTMHRAYIMSRHVLTPRNQIPIVTFRKDIGQTEGFSHLKSRLLSSLQSIDEGDLPFSKEISNLLQVS